MKNLFFALVLALVSFGAFAESYLTDSAYLQSCGGRVELRSYVDNRGYTAYSLKFVGVSQCSNVVLYGGKSYKLTDRNGNYQDKTFTLSDDSVSQAKSYYGLNIIVRSNSFSTADQVSVRVR
jgi:hypothetical protein